MYNILYMCHGTGMRRNNIVKIQHHDLTKNSDFQNLLLGYVHHIITLQQKYLLSNYLFGG